MALGPQRRDPKQRLPNHSISAETRFLKAPLPFLMWIASHRLGRAFYSCSNERHGVFAQCILANVEEPITFQVISAGVVNGNNNLLTSQSIAGRKVW